MKDSKRTKTQLSTELEALHGHEESFRNIVQDTPALICCFLPDGTLTFANNGFCSFFDRKREELIGQEFFQLIPEEDREKVVEHFTSLKEEKSMITYEHRVIAPDGTIRWLQRTDRALLDEKSTVVEYQSIGVDITDRKRVEEELKRESDFNLAVLSTEGVLVTVLDREGRIVRFNNACKQLTGYSFEEVKGKTVYALFLIPEEVELVKAVFAELRSGQFPNEHVNHWVTKDGSPRLIMWSNTALLDHEGLVEYVIGTGIDITKRDKAEKSLRASEACLRTLIDNLPFDFFAMDKDLRYLMQNETSERNWGNVIGLRIDDLDIPDELKTKWIEQDKQVLRGEILREEYEANLDGRERYHENLMAPVRVDKSIIGLIGVSMDITERKQAEIALLEKEQKLEQQAQHLEEVNTALKVLLEHQEEEKKRLGENILVNVQKLVYPYIEKLENSSLNEKNQTYIDIIRSNLKNLISPFANTLSSKYSVLTLAEIQIADLIKHGRTSKEIASLLNVSLKTVSFHRGNIRRKLGLTNKKTNLRSHLQSLAT